SAQETQTLSNFCFLSQKPALVVLNCDPEEASQVLPDAAAAAMKARGVEAMALPARFEAELWELEEAQRGELLAEAGLEAPARDRLLSALFSMLGLITFYTAGEPEAHAWSLTRGSTALEAAAKIHSDIARGFIRAEVVSYADFAELRSDAKVKEA